MKGNSEFRFKKKYGQNFLIDKNIIKKIISASDIDNNTVVIEIGAGSGVLTKELSQEAKYVLAYEIDKTLAPILERNLEECKNVNLIFDDFLKRNIEEDLKCYEYKKLILVANLPYYITTPIIKKIIDDKLNIQKIIIMVQKEVAERFTASPKTREYNSLSIFIDYYFSVKKLFTVGRKAFIPIPNVDSAVISLIRRKTKKVIVLDEKIFFKLIRDSFRFKRKTLKNNLKGYNLKIIEDVLIKSNYSLNSRAEEIPLEIFAEITNSIVNTSKP
jgi:16S rRNA (adenine1518-N6/adenine1519-N6)-dimethyltransferase